MPLFMYRVTLKSSKKEGLMTTLQRWQGREKIKERRLTEKEIDKLIETCASRGLMEESIVISKLREGGKLNEEDSDKIDKLIEEME